MRRDLKIAENMLELIGAIPLVRLNRVGMGTGAEILVKPEFLNPSGSIKDRIALRMLESAEEAGSVGADTLVVEATTGNTGTSLAFVSAVKGFRFVAYAPTKVANHSRMAIMQAYGCGLEMVDVDAHAAEHQHAAGGEAEAGVHGGRVELAGRRICRDLEREHESVWWVRQFSSPENTSAHREWTATEILESTDGKLDAFVASVGTGGTLLGVAQALKARDSNIVVVGVEPAGSPVMSAQDAYPIEPGISDGIIPQLWDSGLLDRVMAITDADAIDTAHQLAEREGIFCGMSSGANVLACIRVARDLRPGARIVTILPDSRDRYLDVEKYTT